MHIAYDNRWSIYHCTQQLYTLCKYSSLFSQLFRYNRLHQCFRILDENGKLVASISFI